MSAPSLHIAVPAWGEYYVDLACRYTVPAIRASLAESAFKQAELLVHTDDQAAFREAAGVLPIRFLPLPRLPAAPRDLRLERLPAEYWVAFKQAHKDALAATPTGGISVLLNSDVVVSRECFAYVYEQIVERGHKVVASVGIRAEIESDGGPPIGADAETLFRWIWAHPHPITKECIWGAGRSQHPTILYFPGDDGAVSMHCFHLTPMFIRKDRPLGFKGTIDDDLLAAYRDDEVAYPHVGDVAFAELSPTWKTHPHGMRRMTVNEVAEFWSKRMMRGHYLRNFRQRLAVLGAPRQNHPAVDRIIASLERAPIPSQRPTRVMRHRPAPPTHIRGGNQHPDELAAFQAFIRERGVRRYLEIGSRNGDSFHAVMTAIGAGGYGLAVDRPENRDAQSKLLGTLEELRDIGCEVASIFGDSRDRLVIRRARAAGPFDLVLIDADHRYEGIAKDFATYGDLAPLVALHDVAAPDDHWSDGHPNGVGRFWREIRDGREHQEIIAPGSLMGFGVLLGRVTAERAA